MTDVLTLHFSSLELQLLVSLSCPLRASHTGILPPNWQWRNSEALPPGLSPSHRIMQAVLDHTIPYLHVREAFGQKIGHFQVSGMLCCSVHVPFTILPQQNVFECLSDKLPRRVTWL